MPKHWLYTFFRKLKVFAAKHVIKVDYCAQFCFWGFTSSARALFLLTSQHMLGFSCTIEFSALIHLALRRLFIIFRVLVTTEVTLYYFFRVPLWNRTGWLFKTPFGFLTHIITIQNIARYISSIIINFLNFLFLKIKCFHFNFQLLIIILKIN